MAVIADPKLSLLLLLGVSLVIPGNSVGWEWGGTFDFSVGTYTWSFTKKTDQYGAGDTTCKMLIYPIADSTEATFESTETAAQAQWTSGIYSSTNSYATITPHASNPSKYQMNFNDKSWTSHYLIDIQTAGSYAVFLEHNPLEFEKGFHFLKDATGADVEAKFEEGGAHGHGHGHGGAVEETPCPWNHEWEWAAIFEVEENTQYDWNAEKVGTDYADAHMKIVILATTGTDLDALETTAHNAWDAITATDEVDGDGGEIPIGSGTTLHFETKTWASHFKIKVGPGTTKIAVFAQHFPTEFERHSHYLRGADGEDIEPVKQSFSGCVVPTPAPAVRSTDKDRWAEVLGGSFITVLPTLLGIAVIVFTMMPALKALAEGGPVLSAIHSFASGVIFAAAVFLLLPEGLFLYSEGKTEAGGAGGWGTAMLGGWIFCAIIEHMVQIAVGGETPPNADGGEDADQVKTKKTDWKVALPILIGDAFHNIADGLVIGFAFKSCAIAKAWKLVYVTVLHEVPQEISDFAVLVTRGRMHWAPATLLNFISGMTTVLGAIIAYEVDVSSGVEGVILAGGAGVYLYVAMTELGPVVSKLNGDGAKGALARLFAFAVGAILIGLVLMDHEHCGPEPLPGEEPAEEAKGGHHHHHH